MLDHEEKFLFKEEILHLANAVAEPGTLDNVEDLLTDVITSPRFDSEVFTLERSLQVMLGPRAGTTLVGLLTVAPEVFEEVAEVRIPSEVHERLVAWRARFGPEGHIARGAPLPWNHPATRLLLAGGYHLLREATTLPQTSGTLLPVEAELTSTGTDVLLLVRPKA